MVKCYVINMEKDLERREFISAQLENLGMPHTIFRGVNGKALTSDEMAQHYDHEKAVAAWRELTPGEIGCALSHIGIFRDMVENHIPTLILEDDARLGPDVPAILEKLKTRFSSDEPVCVLLTRVRRYKRKNSILLDQNIQVAGIFENHHVYGDVFGAHGYFLTRQAAKQLMDHLYPVWMINDFWPKFQSMNVIQVRALVPYCIAHSHFSAESSIEDDREALETVRFVKSHPLKHLLFRYVYQKFIFQILVRPFLKNQKKTW